MGSLNIIPKLNKQNSCLSLLVFFIVLFFLPTSVYSQKDDQARQSIIEQRIETIAGSLEEDAEVDVNTRFVPTDALGDKLITMSG